VGVVFEGPGFGQADESLLDFRDTSGAAAQAFRVAKLNGEDFVLDADPQQSNGKIKNLAKYMLTFCL
jgi:hypothetical protein